jgi:hypothetical protein
MEKLKQTIYACAVIAIRYTTRVEKIVSLLGTFYRQSKRRTDQLMSFILPDSEEESAYEKTLPHYHCGLQKHGRTTNER